MNTIPYSLFTRNHSDLLAEESLQISQYFGNIMYLLDGKDICDKSGIAYLSELFAFKGFFARKNESFQSRVLGLDIRGL